MPLLECSTIRKSVWSVKFQNFCSLMRSVVGGALRVTPSCTVHFISTVGFSAFQPLKSLPLKSWIGLPSFHDPSSLSAMTGARTPVHGVGGVVAPSLPNVPSSFPPVRRACHTAIARVSAHEIARRARGPRPRKLQPEGAGPRLGVGCDVPTAIEILIGGKSRRNRQQQKGKRSTHS